jgi:hypothetical protein
MKIHAFRLVPGQDLKKEIQQYVNLHGIQAGALLSCVGSLKHTRLRLAGATNYWEQEGKQEILSLCGTLSVNGSHLHLCVADAQGATLGGHLSDGCVINTTAEIVLGELIDFQFKRLPDDSTGFDELSINKN